MILTRTRFIRVVLDLYKMEQNNFEKGIRKVSISLIVLTLVIFLILVMFWPQAPNIIATILIFIFIVSIVLLILRRFVRGLFLKVKENREKWPIFLLILLFAFFFYWYQWRPSNIRKTCAEKAMVEKSSRSGRNDYYRYCLAKNKMKPESLFVGQ